MTRPDETCTRSGYTSHGTGLATGGSPYPAVFWVADGTLDSGRAADRSADPVPIGLLRSVLMAFH